MSIEVMDMANRETVKTWKIQVTAAGVSLTVNGKEYELGASADALAFDLQRAAVGYTVPDRPALTSDQRDGGARFEAQQNAGLDY
jgi:hypothetical protein